MNNMRHLNTKRSLGAFYTRGNPFTLDPFRDWLNQAKPLGTILEPFAGQGSIPNLLKEAGINAKWKMFDIAPNNYGVERRDTLKDFPAGFKIAISNPPYLSFHFAKRKGLDINRKDFKNYPSLYLVAIEECLRACDYVALIVPESFITSGFHRNRLEKIISLAGIEMFSDTTMPTCLAMWGPKALDPEYWIGNHRLGNLSSLESALNHELPWASCIKFNVIDGNIGLWAIDNTKEPSIRFCLPNEIPMEKIKHSARLVSRIKISNLNHLDTQPVIDLANQILNEWRLSTSDLLLTAFKGARSDGRFRRRIDFRNARAILAMALDETANLSQKQLRLDIK